MKQGRFSGFSSMVYGKYIPKLNHQQCYSKYEAFLNHLIHVFALSVFILLSKSNGDAIASSALRAFVS